MQLSRSLIISTTGHRTVPEDPLFLVKLDSFVLEFLGGRMENSFIVMSPLAEGADRLIAKSILKKFKKARLHAVLPLEIDDYLNDFKSKGSREEFLALIERADTVDVVSLSRRSRKMGRGEQDDIITSIMLRDLSYEACGHLMVDKGQILFAIWDGKSARGKGGTGEIVQYARERKKPIIWLGTRAPYEVKFENMDRI
ncbi:MAG: hypothetical protein ACMUIE_09255 [Thermoplasmatota archaeon]